MERAVEEQIVKLLPSIGGQVYKEENKELSEVKEGASELTKNNSGVKEDAHKNIGRNEPCPCGAVNPQNGKVYKWKQCGLINASHHKR